MKKTKQKSNRKEHVKEKEKKTPWNQKQFFKKINKSINLFQEEENILLNLVYETSIISIPKLNTASRPKKSPNQPNKETPSKLQINAHHEYRHNLNNVSTNQIQQHITRIKPLNPVGFIPGRQGWFSIWKSINVTYHINRRTIWSYQLMHKNASDKIQHPFRVENSLKLRTEEKLHDLINNSTYKKPTS